MTAAPDWPIAPPDARSPEPDTEDERLTIQHIVNLLEGAQAWLDVLDMPTGDAWQAVERAVTAVNNLGATAP